MRWGAYVFVLSLLLGVGAPPAAAQDELDTVEDEIGRVMREAVKLLRRIEALEAAVETLEEERGTLPPPEEEAPESARPPSEDDAPAGARGGWTTYRGFELPTRGHHRHPHDVEEETRRGTCSVTATKIPLQKDLEQGRWIISAWLDVTTGRFQRGAGALPESIGMRVSMRFNRRRAAGGSYDVREAVERLVGRVRLRDGIRVVAVGETSRPRTTLERNNITGITEASWEVPWASFVAWLHAEDPLIELQGQFPIELSLRPNALDAMRDLASRCLPPADED